jgi:hypothetical protein
MSEAPQKTALFNPFNGLIYKDLSSGGIQKFGIFLILCIAVFQSVRFYCGAIQLVANLIKLA